MRGARCPRLTRDASGRCGTCRRRNQRERDLERGSPTERGYGPEHRELREHWAPRVATDAVHCHHPDCGQLIHPGEAWDLGHDERRNYRGPQHRSCNNATRVTTDDPAARCIDFALDRPAIAGLVTSIASIERMSATGEIHDVAAALHLAKDIDTIGGDDSEELGDGDA